MTSIRRFVLVVLLALGAVACSSGGGSGPDVFGGSGGGGSSRTASGSGDATDGFPTGESSSRSQEGLSGDYVVTGTNPDGSAYRGKVVITGTGPTYRVGWQIGSGSSSGTGTLSGKTFEVRFQGALTGTGTVTYQLQGDGRLVGTWRVDGSSAEGTETLTPAR